MLFDLSSEKTDKVRALSPIMSILEGLALPVDMKRRPSRGKLQVIARVLSCPCLACLAPSSLVLKASACLLRMADASYTLSHAPRGGPLL